MKRIVPRTTFLGRYNAESLGNTPAWYVSIAPRTNQSWQRLVAYEWRLLLP